jgi:hypothetical protein
MFAVISVADETAVFVKQGHVGFWPCKAQQIEAWLRMHQTQEAAVTEAALAGSMFGWDTPGAKLAAEAADA